jgi:hypothetical protein
VLSLLQGAAVGRHGLLARVLQLLGGFAHPVRGLPRWQGCWSDGGGGGRLGSSGPRQGGRPASTSCTCCATARRAAAPTYMLAPTR